MPLYEYLCTGWCKEESERNGEPHRPMTYKMNMNESGVKEVECWVCQDTAVRVPSRSSFDLAGGGWASSGYSSGE